MLGPSLVRLAGGLTVLTALAGTLGAIAATVRLSPAEAMRPPAPGRYRPTLLERLGRLFFFIICLEVGLFLAVFPWIPDWSNNYFSSLDRSWHQLWMNHYFRGAVSGLGLLNILISLQELLILAGIMPSRRS